MGTRDSKTLQQVAQLAGVSASTVSRVINSVPGIAAATADNVRRAMVTLNFSPSPRRRDVGRPSIALKGAKVALVMLGSSASTRVLFYDHMLRGISQACEQQQMDLKTHYFENVEEAIAKLSPSRIGGLLLHGQCPPAEQAGSLRTIPSVWLMGNRRRPTWGDQVMPDNVAIGQLAGQYLLKQGHRDVMYFGLRLGWSLTIRSLAFQQAIEDAGGTVSIHAHPVLDQDWHSPGLGDAVPGAVRDIVNSPRRPTGLFVAEDWLVPRLMTLLEQEGFKIGHGKDIEIVTCNNDAAKLFGVAPQPANIDLRIDIIGQRAADHLGWRMLRGENCDRLRIMIEPMLVQPRG